MGFAADAVDVDRSAMDAGNAVRPAAGFKVFAGLIFGPVGNLWPFCDLPVICFFPGLYLLRILAIPLSMAIY